MSSQAGRLSSQPRSLGAGHSPTGEYVGEHRQARRLLGGPPACDSKCVVRGFESPRRLQHSPPATDPRWGPYLDARSHVVAELADQVRLNAEAEASAWAAEPNAHMPAELIADVRVWRAATRADAGELQSPGHASSVAPPGSSKSKRRPAMAATARHTNPQPYCGLVLAGTGRG